jgi:hypothetical protein
LEEEFNEQLEEKYQTMQKSLREQLAVQIVQLVMTANMVSSKKHSPQPKMLKSRHQLQYFELQKMPFSELQTLLENSQKNWKKQFTCTCVSFVGVGYSATAAAEATTSYYYYYYCYY